MKYDPDKHHRRSIRLKGYDYSQPEAYFVTVCVQNRGCLFGDVKDGEMRVTDAGMMVRGIWGGLVGRFPYILLDEDVIMPNHLHGILFIDPSRGESRLRPDNNRVDSGDHEDRPYGTTAIVGAPLVGAQNNWAGTRPAPTLGEIVGAFKSLTTREYIVGVKERGWPPFHRQLWQRNYYEHIVRNEEELRAIREYIINNPARWNEDENNPTLVQGTPY